MATKRERDQDEVAAPPVSLSLSLGAAEQRKRQRRRRVGGVGGGGGKFVCKTCSRGFASFQALGGHRTSHLRGRHGLALGVDQRYAVSKGSKATSHRCHVCGLGFQMGQALGGHMRRHREEAAATAASVAVQAPPVLLELFV